LKILVFIPSYNDTILARQLSRKFLENKHVSKVLIVDDSDDLRCKEAASKIKHEKIDVISRKRAGKWSAWRLALELAVDYEGLIEVDSDVKVKTPYSLVSTLRGHDVVTAYQEIILPPRGVGRIIGQVYREMHEELKELGKFNMGGQVVALSSKAVSALLDHGFFEEPVIADDHVVALASWVLGLKCTTIDCGLQIRLPATFKEWMSYRSRHRGAIKWAEQYVALKTGKPNETQATSRFDYSISFKYFLKSLAKSLKFLSPIFLMFFALGSVLPIENQTKWSRLRGEKS
jgi:hypothetical protein